MSSSKKNLTLAVAVAAAVAAPSVFATNGMNLEGYGPIAAAMGGASMAYDNGTAALMNNPATLALMPEGDRLDLALGYLGPKVSASMPGASVDSDATAFYMPAVGWAHKSGQLTYGVGMFAQGGMGTEYGASSFMAAESNEKVRSEVGVGRLMVPLAYEVDKNVSIAGSLDYVWAGMDLKMALSGGQFIDMVPGFGTQTYGSVGGTMITTFGGMVSTTGNNFLQGPGSTTPGSPVNWGRFDFSNTNDFTGEAKGAGFAGKIGATFKVSNDLTIGMAYHSKTSLGDLETKNATVTFNANVDNGLAGGGSASGTYTAMTIPVKGKIAVKDFEWPETIGLGVAYKASDQLMLVADYKRINWKDVMKNFKMTFTADPASAQSGLAQGFGDTVLDATLIQNWDDQNVIQLGGAYKVSDVFTFRAGLNLANNPIPDKYVNPLFPATMKNHLTFGGGYAFSKASSFDASFAYVPQVESTNGSGVTSKSGGIGIQLMYANRF